MATIELTSLEEATQHLRGLDNAELLGQSLVQQGAIHVVSYLLANGCNEAAARQTLASLQDLSTRIRAETARRCKPGFPELFPVDQTVMVQATAAGPRMVSVVQEDANRYCNILSLLGMEEEGDPVAEVQRLLERAAAKGGA